MKLNVSKFIDIGTKPDNKYENQRIQAINVLSYVGIVVSIGYGFVWYFCSMLPPLIVEIPFIFLYASLLLLNHFGRTRLSGILLGNIAISQLTCLSFFILGKQIGLQYYLFMVPPLSMITISNKDVAWIFSATFSSLLFFIMVEYSSLTSPFLVDAPQEAVRLIHASSTIGMIMIVTVVVLFFFTSLRKTQKKLEIEQEKSEYLLLNILPGPIADRLKLDQSIIADNFENVSILFADIVDFTVFSEKISPRNLVNILNQIFSRFDNLAEEYKLEKIKTIGDAYMVAGGMPTQKENHEEDIANFALKLKKDLESFNKENKTNFKVRIGINSGPVVAGVIGIKKFIYDVWGDTVNTASRMESNSIPNEIQVSEFTYNKLKTRFEFRDRGLIDIKGKGKMRTYLLDNVAYSKI